MRKAFLDCPGGDCQRSGHWDIKVRSVGVIVPTGIADDLSGGVKDGIEGRCGVDREGKSCLHQPYTAKLPPAENGSLPHGIIVVRYSPGAVGRKLLTNIEVGPATLGCIIAICTMGPLAWPPLEFA